MRRRRFSLGFSVVAANLLALTFAGPVAARSGPHAVPAHARSAAAGASMAASVACQPRVLVLSAMPLELDPLLARAQADLRHPVILDHRPFVYGTLAGEPVILGLTGIGPANAFAAVTAAFHTFRCADGTSEIEDVVFSGTSGGDYIGDVSVPSQWTYYGPKFPVGDLSPTTAVGTSPGLLALVPAAAAVATPQLEQTTPLGDPACACEATRSAALPVTVEHTPDVVYGTATTTVTGLTIDDFGGRTLPCVPTGSDIFGCTPCPELDHDAVGQVGALAQALPVFAGPGFFEDYGQVPSFTTPPYTPWQDNETAVVAYLSEITYATPFIGFRAASDGPSGGGDNDGGDPLMLPGFPSQFFLYRQLAADNAATVTTAFLAQLALH
jgi:hypothetical protein